MLSPLSFYAHAQTSLLVAITDTSTIVIVGFLFVMIVLALLAGVTAVMGALFSKQAAREARRAAEASAKAANAATSGATAIGAAGATTAGSAASKEPQTEMNPELIAVIAAAVHTVIGERPHRIVSIQHGVPGWAQEGRRQIFTSHRVR